MILQALMQLAENEKLIADPDFEFKAVAWVVHLVNDGTQVSIRDNRIDLNAGKKDTKGKPLKPKWVGRDVLIPLFPTGRAGTKPKASFLVDMAKFVFGQTDPTWNIDRSLMPYVERFQKLIEQCAEETRDPDVAAVRGMLRRVLAGESVVILPRDFGPSDLFMFCVGDDPSPIHARPSVMAFWKQRRAAISLDADLSQRTTCLVTGVPIIGKPPLFPLIKNVPGAGTMGSGLLPFNGPSSRTWSSYGFEGNENAPVSRLAAEAAATALNRLADPRPTDGEGRPLPVRHVKLSPDTILVFWSPSQLPEVKSALDALPTLLDSNRTNRDRDDDAGNVKDCPPSHVFNPLQSTAKFYAMTLTGTTGRIIISDWLETTVSEIQQNIAAYLNDLRLFRPTDLGDDAESNDHMLPSLRDVKLAAYRELNDVPAPFGRNWIRVILNSYDSRVSPSFVRKLLGRIYIALAKGDKPADHAFNLLKLFVLREGESNMRAFVNERHPSVAYHCGRLLATLDFAQQRALGKTNTTNVRRMLGAVMTAPALYFGRLRRMTEVAYLPKMPGNWPEFIRDRLQSISSSIGDEIPRLLEMREQSTFFLGFDQERTFLQTHPPTKYRWQTSIGLWVQSRGEREIVEALVFLGKTFLYEPGLTTEGDRERLPDFLVPADEPRNRVFIEYLGMMDKPAYAERWRQKSVEFTKLGILPIENGGGEGGMLVVVDNLRHTDRTSIHTEIRRHLGAVSDIETAVDITLEPEGEN